MATIDTRLLPLIEVLATVDADWLAFEILEGLRHGRVAEETHEDLQITQRLVRATTRATRRSEVHASPPPSAEPITGDEQINWAVTYVSNRIVDVLSTLEATFDQLDAILFTELPPEGRPIPAALRDEVALVLRTDREDQLSVRRNDATNARAMVPNLQNALLTWAASVRTRDGAR